MSFTHTKLFLMSYPKWSLIWYIFSTSGWNIECILTEFLSVNRITIKSIITLPCLLSSTFWYINIFVFNLSVQSRFQSLNLTWFIPQKYIYLYKNKEHHWCSYTTTKRPCLSTQWSVDECWDCALFFRSTTSTMDLKKAFNFKSDCFDM